MLTKLVTEIDGSVKTVPLNESEIAIREEEEREWAAGQADRDMLALRMERNARLAETDIFALADMTLTAEMRSYRQSLRDMPANEETPSDPTWPTKP